MKVAMIIFGILRNYDAALLSLSIFGECDRYLVTWKSSGEDKIADYCAKVGVKDKLIVDDRIMDVFAPNFKFNWLRMLYQWHCAMGWVPNVYDKYVLVRPDGFYWIENVSKVPSIISQCSAIAMHGASVSTGAVGDQLVVVDSSKKTVIENSFKDIISIMLNRHLNNQVIDIHAMLFELFQNDISEVDSNFVGQIESVLVRNTFKKIDNDIYNYELYEAIFHDTAAWWRNQYGSNLGRKLRNAVSF